MSKRLAAKAGLIQLPGTVPAEPVVTRAEVVEQKAKTAPGAMMQFLSSQSDAIKEADTLREQIRKLEGSTPVLSLQPELVQLSKWANRHVSSFDGPDFQQFKDEISASGGNVQPIRVRPLSGARLRTGQDPVPQFELIYGHRRHRACLELGIPVMAIVDDATDQELFETMERENRNRKNLSAWEQGCMYQRAIDEGLYGSQRKLAEAINVDVSMVSKSLALARLPDAVIEAFPSPLEIQFRWAQPLSEALQKDPEGLMVRARAIKLAKKLLTAAQVLEALTSSEERPVLNRSTPTALSIDKAGERIGQLAMDSRGRTVVKLDAGWLKSADLEAFARHLEAYFSR
ncbi:ParB family chromosome partitioning protein [Sphaerotilus hippei]|uniref:ParB family chromosome partitioning protein n=1 Tax=Sphaerotilus hippei TaxID=744406 RepID=A0A318GWM4_9BURK|nr:ParB/RepB/Spo0J family partition protein [Sphaerotilus hippei]PXW93413.1 ParB family chromosome partitioning protein [Sphaerotilus hippei]